MSYKPTYEDPEYYDDSESDESDWQDMPSEDEVKEMETSYSPFITINS